ncbi:fungal-specific transcription factor domain-containing protein [Colletotrichum eremochloae]|nr:fungal-specific transcription factor domain-containing protein [Colletotrichum eremochloae]
MEEAPGNQQQAQPSAGSASSAGASVTSAPAPAPLASAAPTPSASGSSGAGQLSKRRRGLGVVTPNACTECRKKRAKCDGQKPCGRCKAQKDVECVYEVPVRQSKEHLRSEIEQLRHRQRSSDQVIAALVRSDMWEDVLQRLRSGQSLESVSEWLGGTLPSGGGSRTSFSRPPEQAGDANTGSGARPGFPGSTPAPIRTRNLGGPGSVNMSPITGQSSLRQDIDPNSPWHLSSHSQSTRSNSHPDVMNWSADTNKPPQGLFDTWGESTSNTETSEGGSKYQGLDQVLAPLDLPDMKLPPEDWTKITDDGSLVQHLLALYFCWEYPTFASLSKEHFLRDFQNGVHRYCSPILVNALLALGCRFSSKSSTRANPSDPYTSGDHFFKEAQRLFYLEESHHSLTTIQALGIMSIREASCGRDSESWYYAGQSIRLAIEMGLHQLEEDGDDDEFAVQAATFWGAFALDHAWSLATGSLPQCSCFPHLPPKPAIIDDIEASLWIPYTDDGKFSLNLENTPSMSDTEDSTNSLGAPLQRSAEQPSNVRSVYKCFCELSELVHQSLYVLHSPGRPLTSRDLLGIYTQYLNWYDRIPEVLRLGHNFTPAVLFAHMYYHFAILLLFRPLIKLRIIGSKLLPRDVCGQAADAIQGLLRSYSQLYTLRRTPSFVPYFVLTSSIMHLAIGAACAPPQKGFDATAPASVDPPAQPPYPPHVVEAIKQGIRDLEEMAPCHHFAEQALNILRYLAKKWNLDVDMGERSPTDAEYAHLVRPYTSSLNFFAPNVIEDDFICAWGGSTDEAEVPNSTTAMGAKGTEPGKPSVSRAAKVLENPLFWPFPMQGRPMLPTGRELKEAGFERI